MLIVCACVQVLKGLFAANNRTTLITTFNTEEESVDSDIFPPGTGGGFAATILLSVD